MQNIASIYDGILINPSWHSKKTKSRLELEIHNSILKDQPRQSWHLVQLDQLESERLIS